MKPIYFIHSNHKQLVGAIVAKYSVEKTTKHADRFEVRILNLEDYPELTRRHGRPFLREAIWPKWNNDDLQSFTPLRFLPPQLMGFEGRAVVVDPDVFALSDVWELLSRDMQDKAILSRRIEPKRMPSGKIKGKAYWASSVMLLDNARLKHWRWAEGLDEMFSGKRDYRDWISLSLESQESIGELEEAWNAFDTLEPWVKLLHNTGRTTQPWKAGLPIDFLPKTPQAPKPPLLGFIPRDRYERIAATLKGEVYAPQGFYVRHPDANQERFFYTLLQECLDLGIVTEKFLKQEMRRNHIRRDSLEVLASLRATPTSVAA
jgi:hypothetical protein